MDALELAYSHVNAARSYLSQGYTTQATEHLLLASGFLGIVKARSISGHRSKSVVDAYEEVRVRLLIKLADLECA